MPWGRVKSRRVGPSRFCGSMYGRTTRGRFKSLIAGSTLFMPPADTTGQSRRGVPRGADPMDFAWLLESPQRAKRLVKPKKQPQPVFFRPF
jgi:hypothetical protein